MKHKGIEADNFNEFCNRYMQASCEANVDCGECEISWKNSKIQQLEKEIERLKKELLKAREYEFMYKECSK